MSDIKRLTRGKDKMIAGVCAGMARYFGLDISLVRIAFVLVGLVTAFVPLSLIYVIMWLIIPEEQ